MKRDMSDSLTKNGVPSAQPPEETASADVNPHSKVAGGLPAIVATLFDAFIKTSVQSSLAQME